MGQEDIIVYLENKQPLSCREIAEGINEDVTKVSHLINKLIKYDEVKYIEITRIEARERFKINPPKRRCRLYFV